MRKFFYWALFFLFGLIICLLASSRPPASQGRPDDPVPFDASALNGLTIKNFTPLEKEMIEKNVFSLLSHQCDAKFKEVGLRSPSQVIQQTGIVIWPATALYDHEPADLGLVSELTRRALRDQFSSCRAQAGTVFPVRNGVKLTVDGRPIIFLHVTAFWGQSRWLGKLSLHDALVHEFIHAGGQPPTPGWLFFLHDLSGYEHYAEIMEACR